MNSIIPNCFASQAAEAQIGLLAQVTVMEIVKGELGLSHRSNNPLSVAHTIVHEDTENCLINILLWSLVYIAICFYSIIYSKYTWSWCLLIESNSFLFWSNFTYERIGRKVKRTPSVSLSRFFFIFFLNYFKLSYI